MEIKFCKDCRYILNPGTFATCQHPISLARKDDSEYLVIGGTPKGSFCSTMRLMECGKTGALFEVVPLAEAA